MSRLKIYGVAYSRSVRNIWAALELGIDYENVPTGWDDDSIYSDAFRRINPNARVPAIDDDGFILWESLAINLYLAKKQGGALAPATLKEDALMMQWSLWAAIHLERPLVMWAFHTFVNDPHERDPAVAAKAKAEFEPLLGVLEGELAEAPYLVGRRFTMADLNVACMFLRASERLDVAAWPHVKAWLATVLDRPAAKKAWAIRTETAAA